MERGLLSVAMLAQEIVLIYCYCCAQRLELFLVALTKVLCLWNYFSKYYGANGRLESVQLDSVGMAVWVGWTRLSWTGMD